MGAVLLERGAICWVAEVAKMLVSSTHPLFKPSMSLMAGKKGTKMV